MEKEISIGLAIVLVIVIVLLWVRWGPDSWDVQITGVTGDGRDVQYRTDAPSDTESGDVNVIGGQ